MAGLKGRLVVEGYMRALGDGWMDGSRSGESGVSSNRLLARLSVDGIWDGNSPRLRMHHNQCAPCCVSRPPEMEDKCPWPSLAFSSFFRPLSSAS